MIPPKPIQKPVTMRAELPPLFRYHCPRRQKENLTMAAPSSFEAVLPQQFGPQVFIAPPQHPTPLTEIVSALRTIPALDGLADEEYNWLATHGMERVGDDGAMLFTSGSPAEGMVFILKGEVHVRRHNGGPMALW